MSEQEWRSKSSNLKVKTAWLYHVEKMTQEQIADHLQISRVKVMRTLAECVTEGIVVTTINSAASEQIAAERALEKRWNLSSAVVIPSPSNDKNLEKAIGHAIARYLSMEMGDGKTLAIGGGATLFSSLQFLEKRKLKDASVIGLVGSLPHSGWINPSIVAARVAEAFDIDSYQITAPVVVDSPKLAKALWAQPPLMEVKQRTANADIALLTVGEITPDATIFRHGIVGSDLIPSLVAKGAVANVLCYFIDAQGNLVDHELNSRIMAVDLATVCKIPRIVLAAGGAAKVKAILAALHLMPTGVLVTDMLTAQALLDHDGP
ncbi:MAG: sugar-binding domain-containing protein [Hoeflea sp.]|uniref:sugar-binding transcriptional regulator n=1 Tax=Hoeflea sp. TaxID=1940281 RepID=UPI003298E9E9